MQKGVNGLGTALCAKQFATAARVLNCLALSARGTYLVPSSGHGARRAHAGQKLPERCIVPVLWCENRAILDPPPKRWGAGALGKGGLPLEAAQARPAATKPLLQLLAAPMQLPCGLAVATAANAMLCILLAAGQPAPIPPLAQQPCRRPCPAAPAKQQHVSCQLIIRGCGCSGGAVGQQSTQSLHAAALHAAASISLPPS